VGEEPGQKPCSANPNGCLGRFSRRFVTSPLELGFTLELPSLVRSAKKEVPPETSSMIGNRSMSIWPANWIGSTP
jgi:hypothetical protein